MQIIDHFPAKIKIVMQTSDFFERLKIHFDSNLPFAAYRKPKAENISCFLQQNSELYSTDSFSESGFVFAPFDSKKNNVFFPLHHSDRFSFKFISDTLHGQNDKESKQNVQADKDIDRRSQHLVLVSKGINAISNNQLTKVVLSRQEILEIDRVNPFELFKKLLNRYADAFVYIWFHPKIGLWMGATPETLLRVKGLRFNTMALAGTAKASKSSEINWDKKNIEEQQIVAQFIADKLKPLVEKISVSPQKTVQAGNVYHLKSEISGVFKSADNNLKNLIRSLHPTPAVCGLPKNKAKQFILNTEIYQREFYTGFLGELNLKSSRTRNTNRRNVENNAYGIVQKTSELYVNLRCMKILEKTAIIYVGGGITVESNPEKEWEETVNKAQTMLDVLT